MSGMKAESGRTEQHRLEHCVDVVENVEGALVGLLHPQPDQNVLRITATAITRVASFWVHAEIGTDTPEYSGVVALNAAKH